MILFLYSEIAKLLSEGFDEQNERLWVDLDRGQLEDPESFESIIVPAVLVNFQRGIEWKKLGQRTELGETTFSLKVVMMLDEPTFNVDQININLEKLITEDKVHAIVSQQKGIMRTGTRAYPVRTYYVVEHRYIVTVDYEPTSITTPLGNLSLELDKSIRKDENPLF
ncbi:hypothetical protein ACWA1C_06520 [Flectobacillus roseus]